MAAAIREAGGAISTAAKMLGCSPLTIRKRASKPGIVRDAIIESRAEMVDYAELSLRKAALGGEAWAVTFVLTHLAEDRGYGKSGKMELSGPDGGPLQLGLVEQVVDASGKPISAADEATVRLLS